VCGDRGLAALMTQVFLEGVGLIPAEACSSAGIVTTAATLPLSLPLPLPLAWHCHLALPLVLLLALPPF
jgi:hypothetical protein